GLTLIRRSSATLTQLVTTQGATQGATQGVGLTAHSEAGGLTMTLHLPPGPYFLSELLPVDLSLANHSQAVVEVAGAAQATSCNQALYVLLTGGSAPYYQLPVLGGGARAHPPRPRWSQGRR
nr:hypothetical protein [Ktedonobacterales bacterium]